MEGRLLGGGHVGLIRGVYVHFSGRFPGKNSWKSKPIVIQDDGAELMRTEALKPHQDVNKNAPN